MRSGSLVLLVLIALLPGVEAHARPPPTTAPQVDLQRYLGTWYEIARLPLFFERRCEDVTATYSLRPDGVIGVVNRCLRDGVDESFARGRATVVEGSGNARLKVSFFRPFSGDYWILHVDPDYRFALVGTPDRKNLWILAREPHPPQADVQRLERLAREQGYDLTRLELTSQRRRPTRAR